MNEIEHTIADTRTSRKCQARKAVGVETPVFCKPTLGHPLVHTFRVPMRLEVVFGLSGRLASQLLGDGKWFPAYVRIQRD